MVYSGWKFILFLVFGRMTSNFICLTFSTLRSSSLWRIVTIFLSLDKAVYRPGTTSPSSRNLAPVAKLNKPPSKVLEKNKPPGAGGLNRGFTVSKAKSQRKYDTLFFFIYENVVFPTQADYFYFSVDFSMTILKLFLLINYSL